jgi:serine/threonine-protein kinase
VPASPPHLGPYTLLETLETRAFTVVHRAEHRRLHRPVRLKALKPTVSADSPFAADLEREAAVLSRLDHEGVVRLLDLVREPSALYLVLEDPGGATLDRVLAAAQIEPDVALALALAAARALAHAHAHGVVHRAISPSALAITPAGRVLLVDFSAAVIADQAADAAEQSESPAPPSYLAPEQILGEPATPRSDVWSLGVLLHEMLAGSLPWGGDEPQKLASRIRADPPAPLPREVPPPIARLVGRCLAKDPDDRLPDGAALSAALVELLAERTRLPLAVLATRALAAARLGEALPPPAGLGAPAPRLAAVGPDVRRAARSLGVVFALLLGGAFVIRLIAAADEGAPGEGVTESGPPAGPRDRGHVRIVARPWAEVYLDGELVDTTPIGRPLQVTPGKHFLTFRHPSAPDEQRAIKIAAGQTVFIDVSMRIDRGDAGAPRDAGPPPPASP